MIFRNIKNQRLYYFIGEVTNTTNENNGQIMILYKGVNCSIVFVREETEFYEKFELI